MATNSDAPEYWPMGQGSIVGATRRAIHQSEWLESCPAWHVDDVPQHGPCECGADELNAYIAALEQELATALGTIHGEFCAWDKCGHLERIAELRGDDE